MKLPRFRLMLLLLITALVAVIAAWRAAVHRQRDYERAAIRSKIEYDLWRHDLSFEALTKEVGNGPLPKMDYEARLRLRKELEDFDKHGDIPDRFTSPATKP